MHIARILMAENHPEPVKRPVKRHRAEIDRGAWAEDGTALSNAYEQERTRISRELHDDIAQRIALLSAELGVLRQLVSNASKDIQEQVARVASETASIGSDLQRIARGLHPAGLQRLGLGPSIRHYCAQLARAHRITIDSDLGEVPASFDMDAMLCAYRIAQEALHNVVKHSGASHATVSLATVRGELVLRVVDRGMGFDLQTIHAKETLGLISMRERARLVHARLQVSSKPGEGTSVEARVPIRRSFASVTS
jgi:signal transduction histidine kinase